MTTVTGETLRPLSRAADRMRQVVNVLTFIAVIAANGMAGAGAISGESIGVIANRYSSYFLPADYVFAIWILIYLMLLVFTAYQALPGSQDRPVLRRVGWWWAINGVLNIAWVTTFSFGLFGSSLIVMLALLGTLVIIHRRVALDAGWTWPERLAVTYPFDLYFSWICIAVIVNTFQFVTYMEWSRLALDQPVWAAGMAVLATSVGLFLVWRRRLWIFPLVVAWALVGIALRFGEIAVIARTSWVMAVAGLVFTPVVLHRFPLLKPSATSPRRVI